ncbi:MAG: ABC transporter permease [Myxococcota bacterium]
MSALRGLVVQSEVVHAIFLRETRTRFGQYRMGYVWAIADPAIVILTIAAFLALVDRPAPFGMDVYSFIATGIIPYKLFASSAQQVGEAVNGNRALLFYPRVLPVDLAIARWLFELATYTTVFVVLMGLHALYEQRLLVDEPLFVLLGLTLASLLGTGMGLVFCTLGVLSRTADRARGPLLRPLFWISGIFFTVASLPPHVRPLAGLNPVIHCTELVRAGWFESYEATYVDLAYLAVWVIALLAIGLVMERRVRRKIEVT